jgi:hypothetical protein
LFVVAGLDSMNRLVSFDLVFRPSVDLISIVRQFVSSFYSQIIGNRDDGTVSNLGLVTHELLENAIKYGTGGETRLSVEFDRVVNRVAIRMWNGASETHIETLKRNVKELSEAPDAFAHYQEVMRRSAKRTNGSGLGLARIAGEAEMALSVTTEDGHVCVTAQTRPGATC